MNLREFGALKTLSRSDRAKDLLVNGILVSSLIGFIYVQLTLKSDGAEPTVSPPITSLRSARIPPVHTPDTDSFAPISTTSLPDTSAKTTQQPVAFALKSTVPVLNTTRLKPPSKPLSLQAPAVPPNGLAQTVQNTALVTPKITAELPVVLDIGLPIDLP